MKKNTAFSYFLLFSIGIIWGSQFLFNSIAIQVVSPVFIAAFRVTIGALTLTFLVPFLGNHKNTSCLDSSSFSIYIRYVLIAGFEAIIPFFSIAWGQKYIDSSISAILMGMVPIFTGLILVFFPAKEKITKQTFLSIICGFLGLLILLLPHANFGEVSLIGEVAVLLGALSFAIAIVLINTMPSISPAIMSRNILIIAAIPLMAYIALIEPLSFRKMNFLVVMSVTFLGVFCSGLVYLLYIKLINLSGAAFASFSNYLVPLFGTFLGVMVMDESLKLNEMIALIVILMSLMIEKFSFDRGKNGMPSSPEAIGN